MGNYLTILSVSKDSRHRARAPLTSVPTGRVFLAPPRDRGKPLSYSLCKSSAMLWPHRKAQYKQKKTSNTLPVRQEQRDINVRNQSRSLLNLLCYYGILSHFCDPEEGIVVSWRFAPSTCGWKQGYLRSLVACLYLGKDTGYHLFFS